MQDRVIRSLVRLQSSGSTSRLLNLLRLHHENAHREEHLASPLFQTPLLNKAMLVKHRLRRHEQELFPEHRVRATKLILALDAGDLRSGGRFAFIGQRGWEGVLAGIVTDDRNLARDRRTLELLDAAASFDPFLLREHLRLAEHTPAATYFDISPADTEKMIEYLEVELQPLVRLIRTDGEAGVAAATAAMVQKLMSQGAEEALEPLGRTLRLTPEQYAEGVFCWKGFLYYKWRMTRHADRAPRLVERIRDARPAGRAEPNQKAYIAEAKGRVIQALRANLKAAAGPLKVYDHAFKLMVLAEDPTAFRDFLLDAPSLFLQLGDLIGVIDHVDAYWTGRFPEEQPADARADELAEILQDFVDVLGDPEPASPPPALAHVELH
jgi:hypothetical protein